MRILEARRAQQVPTADESSLGEGTILLDEQTWPTSQAERDEVTGGVLAYVQIISGKG